MSDIRKLRAELGASAAPRLSTWRPAAGGAPPPRGSATPPGATTTLGQVAAAGRRRSERLSDWLRIFLAALALVDGAVVGLHPIVLRLAASRDVWWKRWTAELFSWPDVDVQPVVAACAGAMIVLFAVVTLGFTRTRPWHSALLAVVSVPAALAAIPLLLFALGWAIAVVVAVVVGIAALLLGVFILAGGD